MTETKELSTQENLVAHLSDDGAVASRHAQEIQSALVLAKKFPRDVLSSIGRINDACKRDRLAKVAVYTYPRGGQTVTGPSIRLAEVIAQSYGNLDFGFRELTQANGESLVEAYCWDYETNTKRKIEFVVPHIRYSKNYGNKKLTDPRDIYEMVANQASRRVRNCILAVIPKYIVDEAVESCQATIAGRGGKSIEDSIIKLLKDFKSLSVTKEMIEKKLDHKVDDMDKEEFVEMIGILSSLKDGVTKRADWFEFERVSESDSSDKMNSLGGQGK